MKQPLPPGSCRQASVASSQVSVVHADMSSQRLGRPPRHVPVASHVSPTVQNSPSWHAWPSGAIGFEQTPAVHTSSVHAIPSAQLMHAPPATPHSVPVVPA